MTYRTRARSLLGATFVLAALVVPWAQQQASPPVQSLPLTAAVPADPLVTIGTFSNGLRYYVRKNKKAENYAQLRLVVKAGSVLEEDDQLGLAHFVEHMAFNGTKNFPKQEIQNFIQSLGMRFGSDLNASTSYDETIYQLRVPTDDAAAMERAFLILSDWAQNVTFEDAEVESERGVVLEEWRLRRGAGTRTSEKIDPIWWKGTPYAERLPIGKPEIIRTAKTARLKKFYTDWYRPDLMAVIAVGDFDPAPIESLISKHFASIPAPKSPRRRPYFQVPDHDGTIYAIASDKEATGSWVEIDSLLPGRENQTVAAYRQRIVDRLFATMLNERLSEMAQRANPPFIGANVSRDLWGGRACAGCTPREDAWLYAQVKDGGAERALEALMTETARVTRFGFTDTELERVRRGVLREYENLAAEDINRNHGNRVSDYIRHFLNNAPLPTAADELALHQRFLPEITLPEVNRLAAEWFPQGNRFVTAVAPDKPGYALPDERRLRATVDRGPSKEVKPYTDSVGNARLLDAPPAPGSVLKETTRDALGITEWELSNGVKVVLKPTTFSEDQITFRASSAGGTSLATTADYISANTAAMVVGAGGLGRFDAIDLQKVLRGTLASASPFFNDYQEGLNGAASKKDLEALFQLIYLRFTQPRADPTAVGVLAAQTRADMANQTASPDFLFSQALANASYGDHPRRRLMTAEMVDAWSLEKSLAFYKDRFADASDFTFVFVGSFDLPTIRPFVERYLGSLPSLGRRESWKDVGIRRASGVVEHTVQKGIEPRGRSTLVFSGPLADDEFERIVMQAMSEILSRRLLESIREQLGAAYSITASPNITRLPAPEYAITIQLGHDPGRSDDLMGRILREINQFKVNGPTDAQVSDEKAALRRSLDNSLKQNAYWANELTQRYRFAEDPALITRLNELYQRLDASAIQRAARMYLDTTRYVRVTLVPEQK